MAGSYAYDFIVIGGGSAGCACAAGLVDRRAGSVALLEAGPSDRVPLVRMPFGLVWLLGSRRDWNYRSAPMAGVGGRSIGIPRGRMLGGSGSINSMVWFRGRRDDFDGWAQPDWSWADVEPAFEEVEARLDPTRLATPHPLTEALGGVFRANAPEPTPEYESAGVCRFNMQDGRRRSAADAFLRPAQAAGLQVLQSNPVRRIVLRGDRARSVELFDGTELVARKGIVLSAGTIGSPEILLRSGIGPAEDLRAAGIDPVRDAPEVGANLHDHPGCGVHYAGPGSGYGLTPAQAWQWLRAPFEWALAGRGVLASPTVEGGMFFNATGDGGPPDIQSHFIPFMLDWEGGIYSTKGAGYFADAVLCRPKSRGRLTITREGLSIDLGLFAVEEDLDRLTHGYMRLREIMAETDLGPHQAPEAFPGPSVIGFEETRAHIRAHAGTAYHPVGTLRIGGPVTPRLAFDGIDGLWVADASVMPQVTSANTNAPSMMIGYRAGAMIAEDAA